MSLIELSDTRQQKIRKMTNNPSQHLKIVVIILILPTDDAVPFLVLIYHYGCQILFPSVVVVSDKVCLKDRCIWWRWLGNNNKGEVIYDDNLD